MKRLLVYFVLPGIFLFSGTAGSEEISTKKGTVTLVIPLLVSVEGSTKPVPEFVAALAMRLNQIISSQHYSRASFRQISREKTEFSVEVQDPLVARILEIRLGHPLPFQIKMTVP